MPQSLNLQSATPPPESDVTTIHFYAAKNHDQEQTSIHGLKDDDDDNELPDWTLDLPDTAHVRFFRERDWARSRLGPLRGWNHTLKLFARMLFADSRAVCLWW
jgi:hypothetical protein